MVACYGGHIQMNITTTPFVLSPRCYVATPSTKTHIVLHGSFSRTKYTFTGADNSETCLMKRWNMLEDKFVGHYVIGRSGIVYNCVDEDSWANQSAMRKHTDIDRKSIGIFLCNELYLIKSGSRHYAFGIEKPHNLYTGPVFDYDAKGYKVWADYDELQINALCNVLDDVCGRNGIPKSMCANTFLCDEEDDRIHAAGILSHGNINPSSYSLPLPGWVLDKLQSRGVRML